MSKHLSNLRLTPYQGSDITKFLGFVSGNADYLLLRWRLPELANFHSVTTKLIHGKISWPVIFLEDKTAKPVSCYYPLSYLAWSCWERTILWSENLSKILHIPLKKSQGEKFHSSSIIFLQILPYINIKVKAQNGFDLSSKIL